MRTIYACDVEKKGDIITIRVTGNGFLYNMVRIIAGTLVQVGGGALEPEAVKRNSCKERPQRGRAYGAGTRAYDDGDRV